MQHLETLNDVVGGITGIRVWETVPDRVFDDADEVVLVDLPPDDLLQRLKEGKVYLPQQAERAMRNFFRKGNLIALRELALRRTADRVDDEMLQYRRDQSVAPVWQTRESLLACIGPGERRRRSCAAPPASPAQLDVPWHASMSRRRRCSACPTRQRQRVLREPQAGAGDGRRNRHAGRRRRRRRPSSSTRTTTTCRAWSSAATSARAGGPGTDSLADRVGKHAPDLDVIQVARRRRSSRAEPSR